MNLYHFTDYVKMFRIIKSGTLRTIRDTNFHDHKSFRGNNEPAIFFTRNFNIMGTAINTRACLEIDREELKRRYKLYPFNYFIDEEDYKSNPETVESEEIILKRKIPLDNKLVTKIYFFESADRKHFILQWFTHVFNIKAKTLKEVKKYIEEIHDIEVVFLKQENQSIPSKNKEKFKYLESFSTYFL